MVYPRLTGGIYGLSPVWRDFSAASYQVIIWQLFAGFIQFISY
jgi:hypothetical protein